jgi:hypothetical protein
MVLFWFVRVVTLVKIKRDEWQSLLAIHHAIVKAA